MTKEQESLKKLTQQRVKELFDYDPISGEIRWRKPQSPRLKAGDLAGSITKQGYTNIRLDGHTYKAHRLAWLYMTGEHPPHEVDHINRIKGDNRWENLRKATKDENQWNASLRSDSTSGVSGVTFHKATGRWKTQCWANKKRYSLGSYETKEEAAAAVYKFRLERHGEFAAIRNLKEPTP